jgi:HK97 gp10 family phage protein
MCVWFSLPDFASLVTSHPRKSESMSGSIEGLNELSTMLTEIAPASAKRYMRKALGAGADVVQEAAETTVPVDVGILEESIVQKASFSDDDDAGTTTLTVDIGPTKQAFWGSLQEFGTRFQQGQHWLGRAWESCKGEVLSRVGTEMTGLLLDLGNKK